MNKLRLFLIASFLELKNQVTWPTISSAQANTVLVIVATIIFAIIVGVMDVSFKKIISWFYNINI